MDCSDHEAMRDDEQVNVLATSSRGLIMTRHRCHFGWRRAQRPRDCLRRHNFGHSQGREGLVGYRVPSRYLISESMFTP